MKRLAIFVGGLLMLPAFAEVAPVFIDDESALQYADAVYDGNGFLMIPDDEVTEPEIETPVQQAPVKISRAPVNSTPVANRTTATRATPAATTTAASGRGSASGNSSRVVAARTTTSSRGDASRAVASRGTTNASPRAGIAAASTGATAGNTATRAAATRATGGASRTATTNGAAVARTATSGRTSTARTATTTAGAARAATTGAGRVSIRGDDFGAGLKADSTGTVTTIGTVSSDGTLYKSATTRRTPTIRMSSLNGTTTETTGVSMSIGDMDDLAEITDYCKAQYSACMDNYCNVLDDNQGRCSCSVNLKNYAKAEAALKSATEELQDVAQKIQYIGLTKREVETLFTETEAETQMRTSGTDNSQLQASLNKVKDMIINVQSGGASSTSDTGLNFDLSGLLEFSFDSTGFDLASLFGTSVSGSVSNQRGEQLYKTAAARCKASVLKACTARGVDASLVTNAYDLEIDRECMAYERSLNDSNDQMVATVRNAKNVLQKARLMVAQQKNAYDMRGCISALDACMQDEFVCGSDYENCLDPTGRYVVNGNIVVGSQPGHAIDTETSTRVQDVMTSDVCRVNLYRTWDFPDKTCKEHEATYGAYPTDFNRPNYMSNPTYDQNNAWGTGTNDNLAKFIDETVKATSAEKVSENISYYLQNKIGYNKNDRNYGMCMSVLNKCQDYTYTNGVYKQDNEVVKQYLARILVQIKSKQDELLANYAETCVSDVTSCLGQNGYPSDDEPNGWNPAQTTRANIAVNACRAQVVTCMSVNGYSIDTPTPTEMNCWVQGLLFSTPSNLCAQRNIGTCSSDALGNCSEQACEDAGGQWCDESTGCISSDDQCPEISEDVTVKINCGEAKESVYGQCQRGTLGSSSNCPGDGQCCNLTTSNGSLVLSSGLCKIEDEGYVLSSWLCGSNNQLILVGRTYTPESNNTTCIAQWESVYDGGGGEGTREWITVTLDNGSQSSATPADPSTLYLDKNNVCARVYRVPGTSDSCPAPAMLVNQITPPSATSATFSGFYATNGNTQYILANGGLNTSSLHTLTSNTTLYAHWDGESGDFNRYVVFDENNGTWFETPSPASGASYTGNFTLYFHQNDDGSDVAQTVQYIAGQPHGNVVAPEERVARSGAKSIVRSVVRGYFPKQFDEITENTPSLGIAWPYGAPTPGAAVELPNGVAVASPTNGAVHLYASWARECMDTYHCKLNIDANGGVTYVIDPDNPCPAGQREINTGTYALTCSNAEGPGRLFEGFTIDENVQTFGY